VTISSVISGPGEFAHKSPGKSYWQTVTRLLSSASCASRAPALPVPEPVAATSHKGWGMIRDNSPGLIPRGRLQWTRTRFQWVTYEASVELQWSTHQASVEVWGCGWGWCARAPGVVRLSQKILGNSRARRKILGVICWKFWDFCIIRRHRHGGQAFGSLAR
jgi:hypothetical protein